MLMCLPPPSRADRLDPALIRPGRVDYTLKFGLASESQARNLFIHFFHSRGSGEAEGIGGKEVALASKFAAKIGGAGLTSAAIIGFLLRHR
jgi:chaperone BCS1